MAELFIELFSEEIPPKPQIEARKRIKQSLEEKLKAKEIKFNSSKIQLFCNKTKFILH